MARYTGAVCRLCRRENQKLFLKGDRCYSEKCAMNRRAPRHRSANKNGRDMRHPALKMRKRIRLGGRRALLPRRRSAVSYSGRKRRDCVG